MYKLLLLPFCQSYLFLDKTVMGSRQLYYGPTSQICTRPSYWSDCVSSFRSIILELQAFDSYFYKILSCMLWFRHKYHNGNFSKAITCHYEIAYIDSLTRIILNLRLLSQKNHKSLIFSLFWKDCFILPRLLHIPSRFQLSQETKYT